MIKVKNLEIVEVYSDPENFCAETSVVNLGGGELLVVFIKQRGLTHTDTGSVVTIRSQDNGRTWERDDIKIVLGHEEDYGYNTSGLALLKDGSLVIHSIRWRYLEDGSFFGSNTPSEIEGVFVNFSKDKGASWTAPEKMNLAPMREARGRDSILELEDGTLLAPLYGCMYSREVQREGGPERIRSFIQASQDGGEHWDYWGTIAFDAAAIIGFMEPSLVRLPSGRLVSLIRAQYAIRRSPQGQQMVAPSGYLFVAYSDDGGISWSWPRNSGLWGFPADLILLKDGRVLCTYGYRKEPMGVRIAISEDGLTWDEKNVYTIREYDIDSVNPVFPIQEGESRASVVDRGILWHIGYPTSVQLDDKRIMSSYHLFNRQGKQYIEAAIYELE